MAEGFVLNIPLDMLDRLDDADKKIEQLAKTSEESSKRISSAFERINSQGLQAFIQQLKEAKETMNGLGTVNVQFTGVQSLSNKTAKAIDDVTRLTEALAQVGQVANGANTTDSGVNSNGITQTIELTKEMIKEIKRGAKWFEKMQEATNTYANLAKKLVPSINAAREAQRRYNEEAKAFAKNDVNKLIGAQGSAKTLNELKAYANELKKTMANLDPKSEGWEKLNVIYKQTTKEIKNIEAAMKNANQAQKTFFNTADQLKRSFSLLFSVSAIKGYVSQIARVRGEFELQQRALQAILQNKDEANKIWQQTVQLAIRSPFQVKELVTYTKQLAAYRVESTKLYNTTKMLADVSAGLGVDMQRLILAYGQVKAANYLRGTELRQFSEAGINILGELAKYFGELEGRAISVGEVFDRVSKRMVTFADVEEIFKRITSEGGIFYNMQEIQAETLKGQISNLRDSLDIMLNEIGRQNENILKGVVGITRSIVEHWELLVPILKAVVAAFTLTKVNALLTRESIMLMAIDFGVLNDEIPKTLKVTQLLNLGWKKFVATLKAASLAMREFVTSNPLATAFSVALLVLTKVGFSIAEHRREVEEINKKYIELGSIVQGISNKFGFAKGSDSITDMRTQLNQLIELANREYNMDINVDVSKLDSSAIANKFIEIRDKIFNAQEFSKTFESAILEQKTLYTPESQELEGDLARAESRLLSFYSTIKSNLNSIVYELNNSAIELSVEQQQALEKLAEPQGINQTQYQYIKQLISGYEEVENLLDGTNVKTKEITEALRLWKIAFGQSGNEMIRLFDGLEDVVKTMTDSDKEFYIKTAIDKQQWSDIQREIAYYFANATFGLNIKPVTPMTTTDTFDTDEDKQGKALNILNKRISLIKEMNKQYEKLSKTFSSAAAKEKVIAAYTNTVNEAFKGTGISIKNVKFSSMEELYESLQKLTPIAKKEGNEAVNTLNMVLSQVKSEIDIDVKLKSDKELTTQVEGLFSQYQLSLDFEKLGLSKSIMGKFFDVEHLDLESLKNKLQELKPQFEGKDMLSEWEKYMQKVNEMERKAQEERLKTYLVYARNSIGERAKIKLEELRKLADIENTFTKPEQKKEKGLAIDAIKDESKQALKKLDWEEFQQSDIFVSLFKDLDFASTTLIEHTLKKLNEFKKEWSDMPLEDMRAIVNKINELSAKMVEVNPFASAKSLKEGGAGEKGALDKYSQLLISDTNLVNTLEQELAILETILNLKVTGKDVDAQTYATQVGMTAVASMTVDQIADMVTENKRNLKSQKESLATTLEKVAKEKSLAKAYESQQKHLGEIKKMANDLIDSFSELAETLGADGDGVGMAFVEMGQSMANTVLDTVMLQLQLQQAAIAATAFGAAMNAAMGIVGWIVMAVQLVVAALTAIFQAKDKSLQREIEALAAETEGLEKKFDDLAETIDEVYSVERLKETNAELRKTNRLLIQNYEAQLALQKERKQTDEVQDNIEDLNEKIAEAKENLAEGLADSFSHATDSIIDSAIDAATEFVDAWYEAFQETGDGLKGLEENLNEMLLNMIKKQAAMTIVGQFTDQWKTQLENMFKNDDQLSEGEIKDWAEQIKSALPGISEDLEAFFKAFAPILGGTGELSGLTESLSGMTEETAEILAAYLNSIRFYVAENNEVMKQLRDATISNDENANPMLAQLRIIAQHTGAISELLSDIRMDDGKGAGFRVYMP